MKILYLTAAISSDINVLNARKPGALARELKTILEDWRNPVSIELLDDQLDRDKAG